MSPMIYTHAGRVVSVHHRKPVHLVGVALVGNQNHDLTAAVHSESIGIMWYHDRNRYGINRATRDRS